jgi:hypothetical protein
MKRIMLTAITLLIYFTAFTQNFKMEGITKVRSKSTGEIMNEENLVKGYYYFYQADKADRKNFNYILKITDENLREIKSIDIIRPKHYYLVESEYNGDAFAFLFYDAKSKAIELLTMDKTLKQSGIITKKLEGKYNINYFNNLIIGNDMGHSFLVSVKKKGFLYYGFAETKYYKYDVNFYDNNLKPIWSTTPKEQKTKEIELADDAFQSGNYIGSLVTRRAGIFSKDASYDLMVNETSTGKELFNKELVDNEYNISAAKIIFDDKSQNILIFGEYYGLKDKEFKSASLGYFYFTIDLKGNILQKRWISWEKDMAKVLPVDKTGKMEKGARVFVHEIIRTADGEVFVIGEQYKKAASGWGIAMKAMGGNTSTVQVEVMNMVIFQFTPQLEIKKVHIFEKDPHFHLLPAGAEWTSAKMLAYYALANQWFDYSFTQMFKDKNTFVVTYVNYDKEKGEKGKNILGALVYTPEKEFKVDKSSLTRKSSDYFVRRAKDGNIMVAEYFKKERRVDIRLEKLNY